MSIYGNNIFSNTIVEESIDINTLFESFVEEDFNFDNMLREAFTIDILNEAFDKNTIIEKLKKAKDTIINKIKEFIEKIKKFINTIKTKIIGKLLPMMHLKAQKVKDKLKNKKSTNENVELVEENWSDNNISVLNIECLKNYLLSDKIYSENNDDYFSTKMDIETLEKMLKILENFNADRGSLGIHSDNVKFSGVFKSSTSLLSELEKYMSVSRSDFDNATKTCNKMIKDNEEIIKETEKSFNNLTKKGLFAPRSIKDLDDTNKANSGIIENKEKANEFKSLMSNAKKKIEICNYVLRIISSAQNAYFKSYQSIITELDKL